MTDPAPDLSTLARPSGGFAMLAVDQREALRAMLSEHRTTPASDSDMTRFKLAATQVLSPHASAVLVDRDFALDAVLEQGAVADGCNLIVAADRFIPGPGEIVADAAIDPLVVPEQVKARGAVALKLLVIWRPDEPPDKRIAMVEEFLANCRRAGLISIIEPVARAPRRDGAWDPDASILEAALELGSLGADLYKAQVPMQGRGEPSELCEQFKRLTKLISSPWVVLSSGVPRDLFPRAVELACREGASGFLAGRAVWSNAVRNRDPEHELRTNSTARLLELAAIVDANVSADGGGQ